MKEFHKRRIHKRREHVQWRNFSPEKETITARSISRDYWITSNRAKFPRRMSSSNHLLWRNFSPKKALRKDRSIFNSKNWSCHRRNAGRRTKFSPVKSLDSSEFSSEFSDLKTLKSNVKVNPVISWNGQNSFHRIFPSNSQDFTTPQISFKFSGFDYTSNSFLIKPLHTNDRKTRPFREILSQRKGRGEDRLQ